MFQTLYFSNVKNPSHHVINKTAIIKRDLTKAYLVNLRHAWATTALLKTYIQGF